MKNTKTTDWKAQLPYAYWLHTVEGLGNRTKRELVEYAGTAKELYELPQSEIKGLLTGKKLQQMEQARQKDALECYEIFRREGIRFLPMSHPEYPARLLRTQDPPFALYALGGLPDEDTPAVAVIGARECSDYGRLMARRCSAELAEAGIQIISGMARGIDGIAQQAALEAGGKTYAVLGCGVDICYPAQHRPIYERLKTEGGICSEYPPRTAPRAQLFPPRNRIISGLSDVLLIIEAREKSGTLITADMALEQGREVYVLPGRATDSLSAGCNRLLAQGAGVFTSVEELLAQTGLAEAGQTKGGRSGTEKTGKTRKTEKEIREEHKTEEGQKENGKETAADRKKKELAAEALDFYPLSVSRLQEKTGMEYRQLIYQLFCLCMEGRAAQVSTDSYVRLR